MKKIISIISAFSILLFIAGCGGAKLSPEQQAVVDSKTELYTQVAMWTEKSRVHGTNYSVGMLIPVNSKVKIHAVKGKAIAFEFKGQKINYIVAPKHTKATSAELLERLFANNPKDLSKFNAATKKNIETGKVVIGMTKDEVLLARGYPPFHKTMSTEADAWTYWKNRWVTAIVSFEDGKVSNIQGNP